jgi:hypothetical protein
MENELLREKIARLEGGVPFHRARSRKWRGDLACHLPELRRATRLPYLEPAALIVLFCHPWRRGGTAGGTPWPGAAGRGRQSAGRNPSRPRGLAFHGEGHRKVWARLRFGRGLVGRNRVLRLMCKSLD